MKKSFYPSLALDGMKKNKKIYLPYILSNIGMVMMYYIITFLSYSPLLASMKGGVDIGFTLSLGKFVIAFFALIFLLYTNSFLARRRNKEFGLYHVLGMDKKGISKIILWESLLVSATGLIFGMAAGIIFSKFAELGLLNAIRKDIDYRFSIPIEAVTYTVLIFGIIYLLITVKSLLSVRRVKPLDLIKSEQIGERPPKANWIGALIGLLLLVGAYDIAVSIQTPMTALLLFFVAVIMVIIGTYFLFISGSVALCKLLQKNKKYYYKKQHFVSVSSMVYRMKRNGAGLASICILSTMVLVMISSTTSLYFGANEALTTRYSRQNCYDIDIEELQAASDGTVEDYRSTFASILENREAQARNVLDYAYHIATGMQEGNRINTSAELNEFSIDYDRVRLVSFVTVDDYNRVTNSHLTLNDHQAAICTKDCEFGDDTITVGMTSFEIVSRIDSFYKVTPVDSTSIPSMVLVISSPELLNDLDAALNPYDYPVLEHYYYFGFDSDADLETLDAVFMDMNAAIKEKQQENMHYVSGCVQKEKDDYFVTFGGLFFLGIILSLVFLFATAMILYYKQVSEGYEDCSRFAVMRKVGMTEKDIKKSINSQVLTLFFAPLVMAGVHLAFAFPMIWKILKLFSLNNLLLVIIVTVCSFVVFGILYALLYKWTAGAYYGIVTNDSSN